MTITAQLLDLTGDGHGRHIPGTPYVYRHGYKPVDGTEVGEDGIRRPGKSSGKHVSGQPLTKADRARGNAALSAFHPVAIASDDEAAAYLKRNKPDVPASHADAVNRYTGDGFYKMNKALRSGDASHPDVARIDAAMRPAPDDLVLTRHVGADAFGLPDGDLGKVKDLAGKKISDPAYASAALGSVYAGGLGGVTMHIAVPKGTPVVNAAALSNNPHEREVLLGRGTQLAISQVKPNSRYGYDLYATVIPDGKTGKAAPAPRKAKTPPGARSAPLRFADRGQAQKWTADNTPVLSHEQAEAVNWYTGPGAYEANGTIRSGGKLPPGVAAHVAALDSAMSPLPAGLVLTRMVDLDAFRGVTKPSALKGKVISDPAFASTSLGPPTRDAGSEVLMHIRAPQGTPAVITGTHSGAPSQREVVLARGTKLAVSKAVRASDGKWELWLTAVPG